LSLVWWRAGLLPDLGTVTIVATIALVAGVSTLAFENWAITEAEASVHSARLHAMANAARRLGLATDVSAVARAVLGACRDTYAEVTHGGILLFDSRSGALRSTAVWLGADGTVQPCDNDRKIAPGEGLTGMVFASGEACLLRSRAEVIHMYEAFPSPAVDAHMSLTGDQPADCIIAAPMRVPERGVIGVLVLGSHNQEHVWDQDDVTVVQSLADEAAVAIERARLYELQREQAATDPLTGIRNRREFERALADNEGGEVSVLAIDVDNLKRVNDEFGHELGDLLLREVARTLSHLTRRGDVLARVGGDEFAVLLPGTSEGDAVEVAERMRQALHGVALPHARARISVGVAAGPVGRERAAWVSADEALREAKRRGGDRVARGLPRGGESIRLEASTDELGAILDGGISMHMAYQPIVRLADSAVVGYEALARPEGKSSRSSVEELFIAAYRAHRLRDLDWLCRRTALEKATGACAGSPLFVNVTTTALLDTVHPADQMLLLLSWVGRDPTDVVLEISERETMWDLRRLRLVLNAYREHGFRFALDDVGEGHSTLEVLATAMPDFIKLAESLVAHSNQPGPRGAIQAAVAFARSTGAMVIAEGIENGTLASRMTDLGVELGQGYGLGEPSFPAGVDSSAALVHHRESMGA
jgi:diguanylate cyclase (GGDEF)-like protein